MKTEFNVERVCERLAAVVVETVDEWGPPHFGIKDGCLYIHFGPQETTNAVLAETQDVPDAPSGTAEPDTSLQSKPKKRK